ncbi:hypothetical protein [Actinomadura verrucosospora]|uniref:Uncharacterized protein n=1 Tax=Actinomadura verrucosospora TaxID=46165 RepID=A0A7D4A4Q8_ACTVE|nr:hypothetical protein [Actinomadura verrucosospora]QKG25144.1 hypothetical protein ACTIVE_6795 [Actinomadura verrucosospora]
MKNWLYGVLGLVLGIGLFIGGVSSMPGGTVKCGERVMSPGDSCTTIRKGRATNQSYDEQKSKDGREAVIMMIVGPLLAIGCGVVFLGPAIVRGRGRKSRGYAVIPAAGAPGCAAPPPPPNARPADIPPPAAQPYPPSPPGAYPPSAPGPYPPPTSGPCTPPGSYPPA